MIIKGAFFTLTLQNAFYGIDSFPLMQLKPKLTSRKQVTFP